MNRAFDQVLMDVALHTRRRHLRARPRGRDRSRRPEPPRHLGPRDPPGRARHPHRGAARRGAAAPRSSREAVAVDDAPTVIRFPKGTVGVDYDAIRAHSTTASTCSPSPAARTCCSSRVGPMAGIGLEVAERLEAQGIGATVVDPRWVVPVPAIVVELARIHRLVVTIEDGIRVGGIGTRDPPGPARGRRRHRGRRARPARRVPRARRPASEILEASGSRPQQIARDVDRDGARLEASRTRAARASRPCRATLARSRASDAGARSRHPSSIPPQRMPRRTPHPRRRPPASPEGRPVRRLRRRCPCTGGWWNVSPKTRSDAPPGRGRASRRPSERQARAEDQAEVDVLGRGDHLVVEHEPDLAGEPVLHADEDRPRRSRGCVPPDDDLHRALVEALDPALVVLLDELAVARRACAGSRCAKNRSGNARVMRVQHVRADLRARRGRAAANGVIGRPSGANALSTVSNERALVDRAHRLAEDLGEQAVDDEAGGVGGDAPRSCPGSSRVTIARRERRVVGLRRLHDLDQRHDRDRVEEVEARRAARGARASRRSARPTATRCSSRGSRPRRDELLDLGEHVLLDCRAPRRRPR